MVHNRLMNQERWTEVDRYITDLFVPRDAALDGVLEASAAAGLPPINVAPNQGKLLLLLARALGARTILEIGTLGGYSTIWLARALPVDGRLITLETDPEHAEVARANIARAGLAHVVELRLGPALDTLPRLAAGDAKPVAGVSPDDAKMLYRYLKEMGGICASHTSATSMGTDWRDNDPELEPMVEIYQGDRMSYEYEGSPG